MTNRTLLAVAFAALTSVPAFAQPAPVPYCYDTPAPATNQAVANGTPTGYEILLVVPNQDLNSYLSGSLSYVCYDATNPNAKVAFPAGAVSFQAANISFLNNCDANATTNPSGQYSLIKYNGTFSLNGVPKNTQVQFAWYVYTTGNTLKYYFGSHIFYESQ